MGIEPRSFEFTVYDEDGIQVIYDRDKRKLIFNGWYNYIQWMETFEISLEDFLKELEVPIEDIRHAYSVDCFGRPVRKPKTAKKVKSRYIRKKPKLFQFRRGDLKPKFNNVCSNCGKEFETLVKKKKCCSQKCSNELFSKNASSGKLASVRKRQKEINKKIRESHLKRKLEKENK
jgi:hypothetical protein